MMKNAHVGILVAAVTMAAGCGTREEPAPAAPSADNAPKQPSKPAEWPLSDDPVLTTGRAVWLENCENCHGIGKAESPCFMDYEAWTQRITKGESALIDSAINGFEGKSEAGMPPRGGNDELTDEQVAAATKYMIHFSTKP